MTGAAVVEPCATTTCRLRHHLPPPNEAGYAAVADVKAEQGTNTDGEESNRDSTTRERGSRVSGQRQVIVEPPGYVELSDDHREEAVAALATLLRPFCPEGEPPHWITKPRDE